MNLYPVTQPPAALLEYNGWPPAGPAERDAVPSQPATVNAARGTSRDGSLGTIAYAFFALQEAGPLGDLRTLSEGCAGNPSAREAEHRGQRTRPDAFALLGEIGFLDF